MSEKTIGVILVFLIVGVIKECQACEPGSGMFFSLHAGPKVELFSDGWEGDVPAQLEIGHAWRTSSRWSWNLKFVHDSNLDKGFPLNDDDESSREAIMFGFTYQDFN